MTLPHREVLLPSGKPKGVVLNFHGGGWIATGPDAVSIEMKLTGRRWQRRGWAVTTYTYSPGMQGYYDVFDVYDATRQYVGKKVPIIVSGSSAGGHLALMIASRRSPQAVIARGAPTDLTSLGGTPPQQHVRDLAVYAFGEDNLRRMSPALLDCRCKRVLLANAKDDQLVVMKQPRVFKRHHKQAKILALGGGSIPWIHAPVSREALDAYHSAERKLIQSIR